MHQKKNCTHWRYCQRYQRNQNDFPWVVYIDQNISAFPGWIQWISIHTTHLSTRQVTTERVLTHACMMESDVAEFNDVELACFSPGRDVVPNMAPACDASTMVPFGRGIWNDKQHTKDQWIQSNLTIKKKDTRPKSKQHHRIQDWDRKGRSNQIFKVAGDLETMGHIRGFQLQILSIILAQLMISWYKKVRYFGTCWICIIS